MEVIIGGQERCSGEEVRRGSQGRRSGEKSAVEVIRGGQERLLGEVVRRRDQERRSREEVGRGGQESQ